jgi:hypothetical protein
LIPRGGWRAAHSSSLLSYRGLEPLSCASRPSSYSRDGWILASNESIRASCQARSLIEKASAITRRSDGRFSAAVSRRLLFARPVPRARQKLGWLTNSQAGD